MKTFVAELHCHTVLSPCAEVEMIPPLIVQTAIERGINLLAITDHNASANIEAVQQAARGTALIVLPGMELQTREEVHLLCLFDTLEQSAAWQAIVDEHLPPLENDIEHFGEQFVVDETGEFIRRESRLLLTSAAMSLEDAIGRVNAIGGLAIPAHVNRPGLWPYRQSGLCARRCPNRRSGNLAASQRGGRGEEISANQGLSAGAGRRRAPSGRIVGRERV